MPIPVCSPADLRAAESAHRAASPPLMERAGLAVADAAMRLTGDRAGRVLLLAGPGNNGGDALVAARILMQRGVAVRVLLAGDASDLPADAAAAFWAYSAAGGTIDTRWPEEMPLSLIIDGMFGIGLARAIADPWADWIARANTLSVPRLAIDIPSGIDAGTGAIVGRGPVLRATHTLSFMADKPGLHTGDGLDHAGIVWVDDLGVSCVPAPPVGALLGPADVAGLLPSRRLNSHKGHFGTVVVLGGAAGMTGAALLSARAALLAGAGRVYVSPLDHALRTDSTQPELMRIEPEGPWPESAVAVVGPGLGTSDAARTALARILETAATRVVDADALNLIAAGVGWRKSTRSVLTPHPGEAARLLRIEAADVQNDRIGAARDIAYRYDAVCVLKGAGSIIAAPDGHYWINTTGNPGLAAPGTGDVLAGAIGAFLAQGLSAIDAARLAVTLHGAAADALVRRGIGPVGLMAGEIALEMRALLNQRDGEQKRSIR